MGRVKKAAKRYFDLPAWIGYEQIKYGASTLRGVADTALKVKKKSYNKETYKEAIKRLGLTEDQLERRCKQFQIFSYIYAGIFLVTFYYSTTLLIHSHKMAGAMAMLLSYASVALAIKEHFWYTQMKYKRLGFTLGEWFKALIGTYQGTK